MWPNPSLQWICDNVRFAPSFPIATTTLCSRVAMLAMLVGVPTLLGTPLRRAVTPLEPHTPLRRAGSPAMLPPAIEGVELELAEGGSIKEVASFFVDSFWAASTTYGDVEFSRRERKQLTAQMADDFHHRYRNSWHSSGKCARRFFSSRLLVARGAEGEVVGCVGFESALLDPFSRTVHAAAAAEQMMAAEFDCMSQADVAHYAELHKAEVRVRVRVRVI